MRRLACLVPLLLAGCGATLDGTARAVRSGLGLGDGEPDRLAIAQAESGDEDEGATTLRLALGRRQATATLIQQLGERRMWRAPGGVVVQTDGPRVAATAGLPQTVMATRFDGPDPLEDPRSLLGRSVEARRVVDLGTPGRDPATMRFGIAFDCRLRGFRTEDEHGILVEETCRATGMRRVSNQFWADARTNRVGFAEQWVGPGLAPLALDFEPE
ncbi:YjbF family lipoprotein [Sabulicella glaciei]|uniref:YjbF family lipoprotein n=1 Tax=Sabulicella glaciei TaxID=2984948 RepID=A0ABT3NX33_9PROT|nr:YjbF family lipoprotein [Roseococcus sp. MDT2-1-1]MCW8086690.1 YjbF family lipoprotein [Roseococcus sp. MDT2-1-1]